MKPYEPFSCILEKVDEKTEREKQVATAGDYDLEFDKERDGHEDKIGD